MCVFRFETQNRGTLVIQMLSLAVMESLKFLSVLLISVLVLISDAKPTHHRPHCAKLRGSVCVRDEDCACSRNLFSASLICNYESKCQTESIYDKIQRRMPCFRVYKSTCKTDADCRPCNEAELTCEDSECVREKVVFA
ncbi:unnamed protein product [Porites lobata]|uniref:Uncharacterized protein n=1 Tax=Porites lobata TaxID=104759 RepID=A0ABN8NI98_9CNID|nr:unnamed protein product [Porites lobata]